MNFKKILWAILRFVGVPFIIREVFQKDKVTVLLFHDIDPGQARNVFQYLENRYNIISLKTFIEARKKNDSTSIPEKALMITFDDGHVSNYDLLPVFQEMKIPVTIFLCAKIVGTNRNFWFEYLEDFQLIQQLKTYKNKNRLAILAEKGFNQTKEFENRQALSKEEIEEMKNFVDFQAHTLFHPCLPQCTDQESKHEIAKSKQILEDEFNLSVNTISYPNGDYTEREVRFAKEAGYECGITVDAGYNTLETDIFRLKRLSVNDTDNLNELSVKASGFWAFMKSKVNGFL